jgi:hypothetical protein
MLFVLCGKKASTNKVKPVLYLQPEISIATGKPGFPPLLVHTGLIFGASRALIV